MKKLLTILMLLISFTAFAQRGQIYIDSTNPLPGDGSRDNPFQRVLAILPNTDYLQKCGTVFEGSYTIGNISNVTFSSYGAGARPIIRCGTNIEAMRFNSTVSNVTIKGLEITSVNSTGASLIHFRQACHNVVLEDNEIHGGSYCVRVYPLDAQRTYSTNFKLLNNIIYDSKDDAVYLYKVHILDIRNNIVTRANQNWYPGANQTVAAGDCFQLTLPDMLTFTGNFVSRDDTGNKFCMIITGSAGSNGTPAIQGNFILISDNTFVLPIKTTYGGSGIYLGDLPSGLAVDLTFNTFLSSAKEFSGVTVRARGIINSNGNIYMCSPGIGMSPSTITYTSTDDFFKDKNLTISGGTRIN
jgi:hypothetical protein